MAWFKLHEDLPRHPKILLLADELEVEPYVAVGIVVSLWCWALKHAPDGIIEERFIKAAMRATGYESVTHLVETLVLTRLIDTHQSAYHIHDWMTYSGNFAVKRENSRNANAERQRRHREKLKGVTDTVTCNASEALRNGVTGVTRNVTGVTAGVTRNVTVTGQEEELDLDSPSVSPTLTQKLDRSLTPHLDGGEGGSPPWKKDAAFVRFWDAYPSCKRKRAAGKAFDRWKTHKLGGRIEVVLARLEEDKRSSDWTKDRGDFIPAPEVWLNKRRWEDDAVAPPPSQQSRQIAPSSAPTAPSQPRHPYSGKPWAPIADAHWGTESTRIATGQDGDLGFVFLIARMKGHNGNQAVRILNAHGIDAAVTYAVLGKEPDHDPGGQSTAA